MFGQVITIHPQSYLFFYMIVSYLVYENHQNTKVIVVLLFYYTKETNCTFDSRSVHSATNKEKRPEYAELSAQQPKRLPATGLLFSAGAAAAGSARPALSIQGPSATRPGVVRLYRSPQTGPPRRCSRLPSKKRRPPHNHNPIRARSASHCC